MRQFGFPLGCVSLVVASVGALAAAAPESTGLPPAAMEHWTADNGNGTYSNPLFYEEFEDPDVIRVGDDYYLAGTTMHLKEFTPLGNPFSMTFQLTTFQSVRPALFHFNTSGQPGGYVDFDNYTVDERRARGAEREIPLGKTIALTSSADGSVLAADLRTSTVVNLPAQAKFQVVGQGLGRVALKASNGEFVSVAAPDSVVLKNLGEAKPGDAENFQWINLMRGDTMLMSLTNHRYLANDSNFPGPVTASATGPDPARKGGACFQWTEVTAGVAD